MAVTFTFPQQNAKSDQTRCWKKQKKIKIELKLIVTRGFYGCRSLYGKYGSISRGSLVARFLSLIHLFVTTTSHLSSYVCVQTLKIPGGGVGVRVTLVALLLLTRIYRRANTLLHYFPFNCKTSASRVETWGYEKNQLLHNSTVRWLI